MTHRSISLWPLVLAPVGLALCVFACGDAPTVFPLSTDGGNQPNLPDSGGPSEPDGGSCEFDPSYQPEIDPADFTTVIDNPLMPWPVGAQWIYESVDGETITLTVTDQIYTVALGVDCVVVHDEVRDTETNELIEDTLDWYAQDGDGNVWYMGEETAEYEDGQLVTTAGSWEAGVDGAQPGIIMHAVTPDVGTVYRQEYYACEAEDMGEVHALGESATVAAGSFTGCISTRDFTPLDPTSNEIKTYCPDVGNVSISDPDTGEVIEELVSYTLPGTSVDAGADDASLIEAGATEAGADAG